MDLDGAVALVTGGHRRVGRAIALALADRGCDVHLTHRESGDEALGAVADLAALGVQATSHQVDLGDPNGVRTLAEAVWADSGRLDLLVNNAAVYPKTPVEGLSYGGWRRCLDVNLDAPFVLSHTLGLRMREAGGGAIVNLVDWAVERPYRGYLPYFVSKAGLLALTRGLALELAPQVRVNAISPGPVLLPDGTTEATRRAVERATPLGLGTPGAVADAVLFLATSAAYSTGAVLHVDGGRHLES